MSDSTTWTPLIPPGAVFERCKQERCRKDGFRCAWMKNRLCDVHVTEELLLDYGIELPEWGTAPKDGNA